ncbi:MAG: hypothetical protein AAB434_02255 [Planctomycetota bacterium]
MRRLPLFLLLCAALAAEEPTVEIGFGNYHRIGPVPIRVPLANDGPDEEGDLVVEVTDFLGVTRYVTHVALARGARKSIVVHVSMSGLNAPVDVWWCPEGKPRREVRVPIPTAVDSPNHLVLSVCGDPLQGAIVLPGLLGRSTGGGSIYCHSIEPALVPDAAYALTSVDLVYLRKVGKGDLTEAQIEALASWIEAGGHLLISGETADVATLSRFLPGAVTGRRTLSRFDAFSQFYGAAKATPSEIAVLAPSAQAEVPCREGEVPLVATERRGSGRVTFVAFDPMADPFRSSPGLGVLWDGLLARGNRRDPPYDDDALQKGVVEVLSTRQGPSVATVIAGAFVVLVFLVGLRWIGRRSSARPDRLAYAVFSAPVLALLVALSAWVLGLFTRGGDRLDSVVFVEAAPGARRGVVVSFDAFYHYGAGRYDEQPVSRNALCLAEVSEIFELKRHTRYAWREGGASPGLADVEFPPGSSRIFRTLGVTDLGEGVHGDFALTESGASGSLVNGTPWDWADVCLLTHHQQARLGSVRRGGAVGEPIVLATPLDDPVGVTEMARGGRLREGLLDRIAKTWDWTRSAASAGGKEKGDLLLVAFIEAPSMWLPREGRVGTRETVLIVPLLGRDASGPGGRK